MASIRPLHSDHSINEVVFVIQFANPLSELAIEKISQLAPVLKNELPVMEVVQGIQVQINPFEGSVPKILHTKPNGVIFRRFGADGKNELMLRAENNFISVNCFTYTRWSEVWGRVRNLLEKVAAPIMSPENPVSAIILQYIDQFIFKGDKNDYSFTEIFNPDSSYVTKKSSEVGPLWHIHQGWFEFDLIPSAGRCLSVLNINSAIADKEHVTTIDSNCMAQYPDAIANPKTIFSGDEQLGIDVVFNNLHAHNKRILKDLLSAQMQKKIGI